MTIKSLCLFFLICCLKFFSVASFQFCFSSLRFFNKYLPTSKSKFILPTASSLSTFSPPPPPPPLRALHPTHFFNCNRNPLYFRRNKQKCSLFFSFCSSHISSFLHGDYIKKEKEKTDCYKLHKKNVGRGIGDGTRQRRGGLIQLAHITPYEEAAKMQRNEEKERAENEFWLQKVPNYMEEAERLEELMKNATKGLREEFDEMLKNRTIEMEKYERDQNGFRILNDDIMEQMSEEELRSELRQRGYRASGSKEVLIIRLQTAIEQGPRLDRFVRMKELLSKNETQIEDREKRRIVTRYKQIEEDVSTPMMFRDLRSLNARLVNRVEWMEAQRDPIGYFDLDEDENIPLTEEEEKQLEKAPVVKLFEKGIFDDKDELDLADSIPKTYDLDPHVSIPPPIITDKYRDKTIDERKRKYLSHEGGIADMTVEEVSKHFRVCKDFVGDMLCKKGFIPPVPVDVPLRELIDVCHLWDLLEYLNLVDPADINFSYPSDELRELAEEYEVDIQEIYKILDKLNVKAPFGDKTCLHKDVYAEVTLQLAKIRKQRNLKNENDDENLSLIHTYKPPFN